MNIGTMRKSNTCDKDNNFKTWNSMKKKSSNIIFRNSNHRKEHVAIYADWNET